MQGIPRVRYGQTMPKSLVCLFGIPSLTRTKRKCVFFEVSRIPLHAMRRPVHQSAYLITKNPLSNLVRIKHALVGRRGSCAAHAQNDAEHSILFSQACVRCGARTPCSFCGILGHCSRERPCENCTSAKDSMKRLAMAPPEYCTTN